MTRFMTEDVTCPECGSAPGEACQTLGRGTERSPHTLRERAAKHARRVGIDAVEVECPHCGVDAGEACVTVGGNLRSPHTRRGMGEATPSS